ncbi:SPFH domain-containing protein [Brevibacterium sp. 5221]|uniref:SPFH domain-containing protein n=1 Tax=Brevibacterium rongguiense TaxID=2695267 RepID=A0A6N9HA54_9MICO|nr:MULTISPECIES: SPFH domain-containing protein [Brevibacterium]MYM20661.1 SPFH domain-containing protein [Brevibacterium rongguiense]WAL40025.1 SPFH domain-containing protein [Brevibacterium sp. BRM-1]
MEAVTAVLIVLAVLVVGLIVLAVLLFGGLRTSIFFTVHTQESVIVERFGKFKKVARPGLNTKVPFIETTTRPISLRVQQLEVNIETKTKDNVFVMVPVAVQYVVGEDSVVDAYYRLANPEEQIRSYVFDTVRSSLSTLTLDSAFESKDDIASSVEHRLSESMARYGFRIVNTLVTDISPDSRVRDSMNSINAAQRDRVAAQALAEADKIKRVTQAEAEAESKRLQGEGVAGQRKAIATGIAEQYEMLRRAGIEDTAEQLLLMTQYFDTMQDVARNGRSNVLFLPSNPGTLGDLTTEIRTALLSTQAAHKGDEQSRDDARAARSQVSRGGSSRAERQAAERRAAPDYGDMRGDVPEQPHRAPEF